MLRYILHRKYFFFAWKYAKMFFYIKNKYHWYRLSHRIQGYDKKKETIPECKTYGSRRIIQGEV